VKLAHLVGFIINKFVTMHSLMKKTEKWKEQTLTKRQYLSFALCHHPICERFISRNMFSGVFFMFAIYRGAHKSIARPGRQQATATEYSDVYIFYL
jgi:hypothetical protein